MYNSGLMNRTLLVHFLSYFSQVEKSLEEIQNYFKEKE